MERIVLFSYDFTGQVVNDRPKLERKLARDGYSADDSILIICWGPKRITIAHSDRLIVESFPAFLGKFRPFYDLLFLFVAPYTLRKRSFSPDRIVIADFALAWAGAAARFFSGGIVELHLNGLPRDLAATRGVLHRAYAAWNEFLALRIPDRFVAINDTTRNYLLAIGVPEQKIVVRAPDTISAEADLIAAAQGGLMRKKFGIQENARILFSAGRLEPEKGFDDLIRAFALSGIAGYLVIAGEGILHDELRAFARDSTASERIIFAGALGRSDMWNFYKDADAFTLLSKSEALGLVFWEAMYMNVPVIGRPVGGIKETIGENGLRGFFWDSGEGPDAFREKLERCFSRGADVEAMIERARAYVTARIGAPRLPSGQK
jgi:glycosyltransferase involved in cell wall biosynthesis